MDDSHLKGIIQPGTPGDTYQPFVFSVSYTPKDVPSDVWFSCYKDTCASRKLRTPCGARTCVLGASPSPVVVAVLEVAGVIVYGFWRWFNEIPVTSERTRFFDRHDCILADFRLTIGPLTVY
jgi:hypothetical protein